MNWNLQTLRTGGRHKSTRERCRRTRVRTVRIERPEIGGLDKAMDTGALDEFSDARRGLEKLARQRASPTEDRRPHNAETYSSRAIRLQLAKEHALVRVRQHKDAAPPAAGPPHDGRALSRCQPTVDHPVFALPRCGAPAKQSFSVSSARSCAPDLLTLHRLHLHGRRPATWLTLEAFLRAPSVDCGEEDATVEIGRPGWMRPQRRPKRTAGIEC